MELGEGTRFMVLAPIVAARKGEYASSWRSCGPRGSGASRSTASCDGWTNRSCSTEVQARHRRGGRPAGDEGRAPQATGRLGGDGRGSGRRAGGDRAGPRGWVSRGDPDLFGAVCLSGARPSLVELEPRIFSFNSPHGACPRARASVPRWRSIRTSWCPIRRSRSARGRSHPGRSAPLTTTGSSPRRSPTATRSDLETRWEDLPAGQRDFFLYGTNGERVQVSYRNRFGRGVRTRPSSRGSCATWSVATARPTRSSRGRRSRST